MRTVFLSTSSKNRIEYQVLHRLSSELSGAYPNDLYQICNINIKKNIFIQISQLLKADSIVVSSPLFMCFYLILILKILRKKIIVLMWDIYPVTLSGKNYDNTLKREICDVIENLMISVSDIVIFPTKDFYLKKFKNKTHYIPFWPPCNPISKNIITNQSFSNIVVVFAGQINKTRGLREAAKILYEVTDGKVKIVVCSKDKLPKELELLNWIDYRGYLTKNELENVYSIADFGLISLSKEFDEGAFPSKIFDYLNNNIPSIYFGPELPFYEKYIAESEVGCILSNSIILNKELAYKMKEKFSVKRAKFESFVCISKQRTKLLYNILS